MHKYRPTMLLILDGWGYSEEKKWNAIAEANTPVFDKLWRNYPHTLLEASGPDVGLPEGQMGNSEVGHLHIGAGRLVPQDLTRINTAVDNGEFYRNTVLVDAVQKTAKKGKALHIFGLLSNGGIHSSMKHIKAMVKLAVQQGLHEVYLHAFLDGRDTPPKSAAVYIREIEHTFKELGHGKIASIGGRFYAMDRDKRWDDRVKVAYDMLTEGKSEFYATSAEKALNMAYIREETDEFVKPTCIFPESEKPVVVKDGDSIVFMNFRTDRARELSYAFTEEEFDGFERGLQPELTEYVTLTPYADNLKAKVAFPSLKLHNVFGEVVANNGLTQFRIAETEKHAHVTYFLNGREEKPFAKEDRMLVQSPKVDTYDLQPEMSVYELTEELVKAIEATKYNVIVCNFANPDMLGHTGKMEATKKGVEAVDRCLGVIVKALQKVEGEIVIIADHGNAEKMLNLETGHPHTAHTCSPVPFICVSDRVAKINSKSGTLSDVAPTLLNLLGLEKPKEMTGKSLVSLNQPLIKKFLPPDKEQNLKSELYKMRHSFFDCVVITGKNNRVEDVSGIEFSKKLE